MADHDWRWHKAEAERLLAADLEAVRKVQRRCGITIPDDQAELIARAVLAAIGDE